MLQTVERGTSESKSAPHERFLEAFRWMLLARVFEALVLSRFRRGRITFTARVTQEDLLALKELADAGKLTPVIDRTYTLGEVPEAFQYFGTGRMGGKVAIRVAGVS